MDNDYIKPDIVIKLVIKVFFPPQYRGCLTRYLFSYLLRYALRASIPYNMPRNASNFCLVSIICPVRNGNLTPSKIEYTKRELLNRFANLSCVP